MVNSSKKDLLIILFSYPISSIISNILFIIGNIIGGLNSYGIPISLFEDSYNILLIWISINLYVILSIIIKSNKTNKTNKA
ncbi:hypothetical protein TICRE_18830 [Tissierella creatinophila DSM 6911]|uniref:Uncharacterized protein n=1 Tax=Tissierella creatinophila DSM 6911 TaxID=1123403 RepID=A0A1U7M457_TISCR|nr:hypothetical protein TICRE_18830 [Tissierella creatinophila DSM 6911]